MHNSFLQTSPGTLRANAAAAPSETSAGSRSVLLHHLTTSGTVGTHGIAPLTSIITPIVCRLNPWVTLLGTITYPLPFKRPSWRWFSGFLQVGYVSSLEDNRFCSQLKADESLWWISCHVISVVLLFCSKSTESIQFTQYGESRSIFPNHEPASLIHI